MKEFDSNKLFNSAVMDESIRQFKETLPRFIELASLRAKVNRALYDAMIKEGFSKSEALEYIKYKGV